MHDASKRRIPSALFRTSKGTRTAIGLLSWSFKASTLTQQCDPQTTWSSYENKATQKFNGRIIRIQTKKNYHSWNRSISSRLINQTRPRAIIPITKPWQMRFWKITVTTGVYTKENLVSQVTETALTPTPIPPQHPTGKVAKSFTCPGGLAGHFHGRLFCHGLLLESLVT